MLVDEGLPALPGDLHDVAPIGGQRGLAAQTGVGLDVERLVHDVLLALAGGSQRVEALADVDVAGRAGTHPATGRADLGPALARRLQDGGAGRNLDLVAVGLEADPGHD
jgi:hypothetical protein